MTVEWGPPMDQKHHGKTIPSYIVVDGARYDFNRIAEEEDGGVPMSQLNWNECVIAPGLIYRFARKGEKS